MCGYCTEESALDILCTDMQGSLQMKDMGNINIALAFCIGLWPVRIHHRCLLSFASEPFILA